MNTRIITTALAASILAIPAVADAPGYFQIPGTETTLKVYGKVQLDTSYDMKGGMYGPGNALDTAKADGKKPDNQFSWEARGRIGFTTTTPTSFGDVMTKFEGQATGSNGKSFNMRHAYAKLGGFTVGLTDSTFVDGNSTYSCVDQGALFADWAGRVNQVRYTFDINKQASFSVAIEEDQEAQGDTSAMDLESATGVDFNGDALTKSIVQNDKKRPSFVGAFDYSDDWGHAHAAVAVSRYAGFISKGDVAKYIALMPAGTVVKEYTFNKTAFAWSVGGSFNIGNDNVGLNLLGGNSSFYSSPIDGTTNGFANIYGTDTTPSYVLRKSFGGWANYQHVWSDKVTSNLVVGYMKFADNDDLDGKTILVSNGNTDSRLEVYLNTFVKVAKNSTFGVEYVYGKLTTKGSKGVTDVNGHKSDNLKESRINLQLLTTLF